MLGRLGLVMNWIGNILAAICILIALFLSITAHEDSSMGLSLIIIGIGAISALICWGAGRALRFVLSGF